MKWIIKSIISSILLATIAHVTAQDDISGVWEGVLAVGTTEIDVEFTLTADGAGGYSAVMDAPDQPSITNMAVDSVSFDGGVLSMTIAAVSGEYSGTFADGSFAGTWTQQGQELALDLAPYEEPVMTAEAFALVNGSWVGSIKPVPNAEMELTVVLEFEEESPGVYSASLSSPDQGASDIPADAFSVEGNELTLEINRMRLEIETTITGDQMSGMFTQAGREIPIVLDKGEYQQAGLGISPLSYARIQGPWHAEVQGLNVQIRIEQRGDNYVAFLDSPDQGASDIPISSMELEGDTLTMAVTAANMTFSGELGDEQIVGTWSQMGTNNEITFMRGPYNAAAGLDAAVLQQLLGSWRGSVNNTELVFEFSEQGGSLSIPSMNAQGLGLSALEGDAGAFTFAVRGIQASFAGSIDGSSINGEWTRAGNTSALNLAKD